VNDHDDVLVLVDDSDELIMTMMMLLHNLIQLM
jgi:hypothetical protein